MSFSEVNAKYKQMKDNESKFEEADKLLNGLK